MTTIFWTLFSYCLVERLLELISSRNNQDAMRAQGFQESETASGMRAMIALHACWYLSLLGETLLAPRFLPFGVQFGAIVAFLGAQGLRVWTLTTLGRYWNVSVLTNRAVANNFISHGPYRFIRHPNYAVVIVEIFTLPLIGNAPLTAVLFSVANGALLRRRISLEERSLLEIPGYKEAMGSKPRFLPLRTLAR